MNWTSSVPKTFWLDVTPTVANQMLAASGGNRKLRRQHISALKEAIERGDWRESHQGFAFDWNGVFRDGHHRATAIVMTGITVRAMVTLGLDPSSFDAIDQGAKRNLGDLLSLDRGVAEVLRLATRIFWKNTNVTAPMATVLAEAGFVDLVEDLVRHCGSRRKYFSSAPMRLAAVIFLMNGANKEFVYSQYRALCILDFDSMTPAAKSLVRQVDSRLARTANTGETLARGLRVFDPRRAAASKVQISNGDIEAAHEFARVVMARIARLPSPAKSATSA